MEQFTLAIILMAPEQRSKYHSHQDPDRTGPLEQDQNCNDNNPRLDWLVIALLLIRKGSEEETSFKADEGFASVVFIIIRS